jgi:GNAT superfamily N-acetyltransferase
MPARKKQSYEIRPLTKERWSDFEKIFGPSGGFWGCWCMYWRAPRDEFEGPERKTFKSRFKALVAKGPPPGLIAYASGDEPVGWIQVGPRAGTPNWNGKRRLSAPVNEAEAEDPSVWGVNCFVVRPEWRGKGVARALVGGAVEWARKNRARALDACPVEIAREKKPPVSLYYGTASMFRRAGFREVARRRDNRPLMRLDLSM